MKEAETRVDGRLVRSRSTGVLTGLPEVVIVPGLGAPSYVEPWAREMDRWTRATVLDLPGWRGGRGRASPATIEGVARATSDWLRATDGRHLRGGFGWLRLVRSLMHDRPEEVAGKLDLPVLVLTGTKDRWRRPTGPSTWPSCPAAATGRCPARTTSASLHLSPRRTPCAAPSSAGRPPLAVTDATPGEQGTGEGMGAEDPASRLVRQLDHRSPLGSRKLWVPPFYPRCSGRTRSAAAISGPGRGSAYPVGGSVPLPFGADRRSRAVRRPPGGQTAL